MLICEMNTKKAENMIKKAVELEFPNEAVGLFYEHGQWWAGFFDGYEGEYKTFSVNDAEGLGIKAGFDFEEV